MNSDWVCDYCDKKYKTLTGFKKHKCKNKRQDTDDIKEKKSMTILPKKRKKKISPHVRFDVWKKYIGNKIEAKCFCCWKNNITPFTYCNTFHAGHIKSEANGGEIKIANLLPICSDCNKSMGTVNWDEYIEKYTNFRLRIYGDNIPESTILKIKTIQKICRLFLLKKKEKLKKKRRKKKKSRYLMPTVSFLKKQKIKRNIIKSTKKKSLTRKSKTFF